MTGEGFRDAAKAWCLDALRRVGPSSPTLCQGWDAHDLAVHLWVLNHDPASWPMVGVPALAAAADRRAARTREAHPYERLLDELDSGPGGFACMPGDAWEGHRHAMGEWFVHGADVRLANGIELPRTSAAMELALWKRAVVASWWLQGSGPALELVWPATGRRARIGGLRPATRREPTTVVAGSPAHLLLWVHGRREVADVRLTSRPS